MYDAIVIGAGAAGLAAARELSGARKRVAVIEARERIGGRVHTLHLPDAPLPIELGAEFIHGDVDTTFAIVQAASLLACELPDDHWWSQDGSHERIDDYWGLIDRVRARIGPRKRDVSFADFLRTRRSLDPRTRELARTFVEGYHAAHADRISALALKTADQEQENPGGNKQFRLLCGYDGLLGWLRAGLDPTRVDLRLGTTATRVVWRQGDVAVDIRGAMEETLKARAVVITIPIGVWKAARDQNGTIRFDPALEEKERALAQLEVGHVVKIAFRFRERWWDERNFVHTSDRFVPTWWTMAPVRAPILTAWSGGHAADALLAEGDEAMADRALDAMAVAFGRKRRAIEQQLVAVHTHNWQTDPYARGAYSYAAVGGSKAHAALAKPLRNTLYFAGEATSSDQTGTVAGAIESGRRAAVEVLRAGGVRS